MEVYQPTHLSILCFALCDSTRCMNSWTESCCVTYNRLNIELTERMTMANRDNYRTRERAKH